MVLAFAPSCRSEERSYRCEAERVNLDAEGSVVLLLELAGQMALDEGCLSIVRRS